TAPACTRCAPACPLRSSPTGGQPASAAPGPMARPLRSRRTDMRRAVAALRTLAVAASLAAAGLTITAPPAVAAGPPGAGRDSLLGLRAHPDPRGDPGGEGPPPAHARATGNLGTGARLVARRIPPPVRPGQRFEGHRPYLDHERRRFRPAPARLRRRA